MLYHSVCPDASIDSHVSNDGHLNPVYVYAEVGREGHESSREMDDGIYENPDNQVGGQKNYT